MNWLTGLVRALEIIPTVVDTVMKVVDKFEDDYQTEKSGVVKKQAVMNLVHEGINAAQGLSRDSIPENERQALIGLTGTVTDTVVSMRNKTGKYKRSDNVGNEISD